MDSSVTAADVDEYLLRELAVQEWVAEVLMEDLDALKEEKTATFHELLRVRSPPLRFRSYMMTMNRFRNWEGV